MTTETKKMTKFINQIGLDTTGKIVGYYLDNNNELLAPAKGKIEIIKRQYFGEDAFVKTEQAMKTIMKNAGQKHSLKGLAETKSSYFKVLIDGIEFDDKSVHTSVLKIGLNEQEFVKFVILKTGKEYKKEIKIEPEAYEKMCILFQIENQFIKKTKNGFLATENAFEQKVVVDSDGYVINPHHKKTEDDIGVVTYIKIMGYGGGPACVFGATYRGKFYVSSFNSVLLKFIPLEDSTKNDSVIYKGKEFYISSNCVEEMY